MWFSNAGSVYSTQTDWCLKAMFLCFRKFLYFRVDGLTFFRFSTIIYPRGDKIQAMHGISPPTAWFNNITY